MKLEKTGNTILPSLPGQTAPVYRRVSLNSERIPAKLGNIPAYIEGEAAWSYLSRLADSNAHANTVVFLNTLFGKLDITKWTYDAVERELFNIFKVDGIDEWNYTSSVFQYLKPFISAERHDARIRGFNEYPATHDRIVGSYKPHIKKLNSCPMCRARDAENGVFYYHTIHQIPGLTLCPEHMCQLEYFSGKHGEEISKPEFSPVDHRENEETYASFCRGLVSTELPFDFSATKEVLMMKLSGKFKDSVYVFAAGYNEIAEFLESIDSSKTLYNALVRTGATAEVSVSSVISALIYFYGDDVEAFKHDALSFVKPSDDENFIKRLEAGYYSIVGSYNPDFLHLKYQHPLLSTTEDFVTTKHAFITGWTSPKHDSALSPAELFRELFYASPNIENYELVSDFTSWQNNITLKNAKEKIQIEINASDYIYYGVRESSNSESLETIKKTFEKYPDFEILDITGSAPTKIHVRHTCGNETYFTMAQFYSSPYCKACRDKARWDKLAAEIKDISHGTFTLSEISRSRYSATDGENTITAYSSNDLKAEVYKIVYHISRQAQFVSIKKALEYAVREILNTRDGQKILYTEDFKAYGKLKDIQETLKKFTKEGFLLQLGTNIFCRKDYIFSTKDICSISYMFRHNRMVGIPVGSTLLEEIGMTGQQGGYSYATNLASLVRSNRKVTFINGEKVTLLKLKTDFNEDNWKTLSLLMTLQETYLVPNWTNDVRSTLLLWTRDNLITEEKIRKEAYLFEADVIEKAVAFIGGKTA